MLVYHGSYMTVEQPLTSYSIARLDFGQGFYVTTVKEQAERWARRKSAYNGKLASVVNVFQYEADNRFNIKDFGDDKDEWIDFVCACRSGSEIYKQFDVIKGLVADDKVFRVVDMYRRGFWDKTRTINEMRAYPTYDQIAFISQDALNSMLSFCYSYEVEL